MFFTYFFTLEALMKIIAYGFILDQNSYLKENWSVLDFFIVVTSLVDTLIEGFFIIIIINTGVDLSAVKILRLLRTFRPLRFITHNVSMKVLVISILESVIGILNVIVVLLLVWMMFGILGSNFW